MFGKEPHWCQRVFVRTKTVAIAGIPRVVFVGFQPSPEVRVIPWSVSLKGQYLPAAVPRTTSKQKARNNETKLLPKHVIELLKCCFACKRVSEVQRSTMSCMRTLQRGCRCLLPWELVADVPFKGMLSLNTAPPCRCSIPVILKWSSPWNNFESWLNLSRKLCDAAAKTTRLQRCILPWVQRGECFAACVGVKRTAESVLVSDMFENMQSGFALINKTLSIYLPLNIISYFMIGTHKQIRMLEASGKSLTDLIYT